MNAIETTGVINQKLYEKGEMNLVIVPSSSTNKNKLITMAKGTLNNLAPFAFFTSEKGGQGASMLFRIAFPFLTSEP